MRKVDNENRAVTPKWTDLHVCSTHWRFKNCLKSKTQVIIEGSNVKQTPDKMTTVTAGRGGSWCRRCRSMLRGAGRYTVLCIYLFLNKQMAPQLL